MEVDEREDMSPPRPLLRPGLHGDHIQKGVEQEGIA